LSRKAKKRKSRGVVDTNVLVAGISGFRKPYVLGKNTSADVLYKWAEKGNLVWLVTEDILDEYKEVLKRLGVRSTLIGAVINLIRERAEPVNVHASFEIRSQGRSVLSLRRKRKRRLHCHPKPQGLPARTTQGKSHLTRSHGVVCGAATS
jgi:hypothetical protein